MARELPISPRCESDECYLRRETCFYYKNGQQKLFLLGFLALTKGIAARIMAERTHV